MQSAERWLQTDPALRIEGRCRTRLQGYPRAVENGEPVVLALWHAAGSTPAKRARMLVRADGSFCGTIGGGCGESEVLYEAMEAHKDGRPRLVQVDLTNPIDGDDKICGGVMDVFVEPLLPTESA
jgi:xanthine dehydrogenase accessory factor